MKEITWSAVKQRNLTDIVVGECLRVTGDGQTVFYVVVRPEGAMVPTVEGVCSMIDASRGF